MNTIQRILDKKSGSVSSIEADATVLDAAKLMNERRIGALVVTRGKKVIGIFTERDILNRVVAAQRSVTETTVNEVMTAPIACCRRNTTEAECRAVMRSKRIRHIPVVEDDCLVGIISIGDIIEEETAQKDETIHFLHEYLYGTYR